jgi:hypothetical protein
MPAARKSHPERFLIFRTVPRNVIGRYSTDVRAGNFFLNAFAAPRELLEKPAIAGRLEG